MNDNSDDRARPGQSHSEIQRNAGDIEEALDRLLAIPEVASIRDEIQDALEVLAGGGSPDDLSLTARRALRLVFGGYLDMDDRPRDPDHESAVGDRPDDTGGLDAISTAVRPPSLSRLANAVVEPATGEGSDGVTLVFLADPQVSRAEQPHTNENPRVVILNEMNEVLNGIHGSTWPTGMGLSPSVEGTLIGPISGVFFGGDMCQTGGDYNFLDQFAMYPPYYLGGFELQMIRRLFDPSFASDGLTKLATGPVFFGLGNHDVQSEYNPGVGWFKGCFRWSTPSDYWRYQMWNFICQMHRGVFTNCIFNWSTEPAAGVPSAIDAKDPWSNSVFEWTERSLNYRVEIGPCDIYQLHVYGGDAQYGRAPGLSWLKDQLAARGTARPVIIVQHYDFGPFSIPGWWSPEQRDELLTAVEPYNVIAFLMGHNHTRLYPIPGVQGYPNSTKVVDWFRPGSAGVYGNFAILRVSPTTLDIMQASGAGKTLTWYEGYSKTWPGEKAGLAPSEALAAADGRLPAGDDHGGASPLPIVAG